MMKGYRWGLNPHILKILYNTVTEKIVTYGAAVWALPMQGRKVKHLQSIQRPFLLNITRAFRTSPTNALAVLAGILPLSISVEKEATYQIVKQLGQTKQFGEEVNLERAVISLDRHPSLQGRGVNVNLKQTTRSTNINVYYYTDGFKIDDSVGCAYAALKEGRIVSQWKGHLGAHNSVFQSEATAISYALQAIIQQRLYNSYIITGSLSTLYVILNPTHSSPIIAAIQEYPLRAHKELKINLEWTKAHIGNHGNETADRLAKEAAHNVEAVPWPVSHLKRNLRATALALWQAAWDNEDTGRRAHTFLPKVDRELLVARPQMVYYITGHGPFPVYFERFGISNSDQCCCGDLGTAEHYVHECPLTEGMHIPFPQTNRETFNRFMVKQRHQTIKITHIVDKLMDMGPDLCHV
ncbi:uncharacterized protein LOC118195961 [Stegodyphus dumicola]|uniref:uncharacterized protein LOC118195961 n=1 Tax=Stegodyphus dumicola TaxID=202533 RepID=UPI0015ACBE40|nr:uncharacterized protein LOC118195961 [Stegodyphus dumicola]